MANRADLTLETLPLFRSALLDAQSLVQIEPPLIPQRVPAAGEQYRFHFDMSRCIGCKCCVVACNEQNGNPAAINWRRVGEIEGGYYPYTQRHYLSMGCNHCLEPSCLIGCPVEAYTKDPKTGVVLHSADTCIGCQYCTWNCSYGVPQYNPERGVVGKCDLCHERLADDMSPACVAACPEGAIGVEIVKAAAWRSDHLHANAPGLPSADDSISTTRITLPQDLPPDAGRVDTERVVPQEPHWPLVFMLVLTQLAVGAFGVLWLLDLMSGAARLFTPALVALAAAGLSLGASTLHLGRPAYAWRALRGWRRSWLSREVLAMGTFAAAASIYAGMLFFGLAGRSVAGLATVGCGAIGVLCSARIYMVRARPAWNSLYTIVEFLASPLLLGPLAVRALNMSPSPWMVWTALAGGLAQLFLQTLKCLWLSHSDLFELRASARLLAGRLGGFFMLRLAILLAAGVILPLVSEARIATLILALAGEWLGRWLFFVSVVPKNIAAAFGSSERSTA